jgi:hypothetical protein
MAQFEFLIDAPQGAIPEGPRLKSGSARDDASEKEFKSQTESAPPSWPNCRPQHPYCKMKLVERE